MTYPVGRPTRLSSNCGMLLTRRAFGCVRPWLSRPTARGWHVAWAAKRSVSSRPIRARKTVGKPGNGRRASAAGLDPGPVGRWQVAVHVRPRRPGPRLGLGDRQGNRACKAPDHATHAVFSSDGRIGFATDRDFTLCGAGGEQTWKIDKTPVSVALSPDGSLVALRFWPNPEVHLRDATTGQKRYTLGQASDRLEMDTPVLTDVTGVVPAHLVFSPDGRWLAGAGQTRQFCLWDVATGTVLWQLPTESGPAIERFAFSANSLCLATVNADHTVALYDALTGAKRGRLGEADPKKRSVHLERCTRDFMQMRRDLPVCLAFSPDGRYLAMAKDTPEIHLWDVLAGREVGQLKGHEGSVVSLLFSPDGKHLSPAVPTPRC